MSGTVGDPSDPRENLISNQGIAGLWTLAQDDDRLSAAERALLALALSELENRRDHPA